MESARVTLSDETVNVICLPTKHQRALGTRSKVYVRSRSNWNLEMLVFVGEGKPENPEKNPRSRDENQQQTQPLWPSKRQKYKLNQMKNPHLKNN